MSRRRHTIFFLLLLLFLLTISISPSLPFSPHHISNTVSPANSTLGFGTILAVSHAQSPRRASLLWAANLTDIDIVIPKQQFWTEAEIAHLRGKDVEGGELGGELSRGSALAWLGHLDALRWFLDSEHETALILEDDTDFALSIRHTQIPLLAAAVRSLLSPNTSTTSTIPISPTHPNSDPNFWAPATKWDILYPGHCDDLPSPNILTQPYLAFHDPSTPPSRLLHPDTSNFLSTLSPAFPAQTRILHRTFYPFCTFSYAVTRRSAAAIISRGVNAGIPAYDVALLQMCRDGDVRCWSVAPEVFHHGVAGSEIVRADGKEAGSKLGVEVPERGTWNLRGGCGARYLGVWVEEGKVEEREEVKRLVKRMVEGGMCPGDGRERGWVGCEYGECGAQS